MEKTCCSHQAQETPLFIEKLTLYRPLLAVAAISIVMALALASVNKVPMMDGMMGFFLCFLAALKLFNLTGFANNFAKYDVIASRSRLYAVSYPSIELCLAALYFSGVWPITTNIIMIVVMLIGSIGIIKAIRSREQLQCACVGTGFNLPVGRVTLFENVAMALMAMMNLFHLLNY